jgi:transposase-like protein
MEKLFHAMGIESISKSQVSEICKKLDTEVNAFRARPLTGRIPYLFFDALYEKVRIGEKVVSQAVVIAYGVREDGTREIIGVDVVDTESYISWKTFMQGLKERGLSGTKLVISDAHLGLKKAIQEAFLGATWQRCKVHFMRNILAVVNERHKKEIAAELVSIFAQPTKELARRRAREVIAQYESQASTNKATKVLDEGLEDALSFYDFPQEHRRKIATTNPIEHINRDIRRRTNPIGVFPNIQSAVRLITMVLIEQTEDWQSGNRYMSQESMTALYEQAPDVSKKDVVATV